MWGTRPLYPSKGTQISDCLLCIDFAVMYLLLCLSFRVSEHWLIASYFHKIQATKTHSPPTWCVLNRSVYCFMLCVIEKRPCVPVTLSLCSLNVKPTNGMHFLLFSKGSIHTLIKKIMKMGFYAYKMKCVDAVYSSHFKREVAVQVLWPQCYTQLLNN